MPLDVARRGTLDVRDPPLKAIVAANDNYEEGYHKGNAGGLDAVDTELAVGNIKDGVNIFGKLGTFAGGPPIYDDEGLDKAAEVTYDLTIPSEETPAEYDPGVEHTILSKSLTCAQDTIIFAFAYGWLFLPNSGSAYVMRLYIDGVLIDSAPEIVKDGEESWDVFGHRSVSSGARLVEVRGYSSGTLKGKMRFTGALGAGCPKI